MDHKSYHRAPPPAPPMLIKW